MRRLDRQTTERIDLRVFTRFGRMTLGSTDELPQFIGWIVHLDDSGVTAPWTIVCTCESMIPQYWSYDSTPFVLSSNQLQIDPQRLWATYGRQQANAKGTGDERLSKPKWKVGRVVRGRI